MKRLFDILASSLALALLSPVFAALAAAVWIADGPPAIFRQVRVGRHGLDFTLFKFRTMSRVAGAERGAFDAGDRSRVTAIGKVLRRTKLDELPQLWNVLRGDMSLVGPRPEVRRWVNVYPERWKVVHSVQPGITDPASLLYRNEEELLARVGDPDAYYQDVILPRKLALYETYVRERGMLSDIALIFRTLAAVVCRQDPSGEPS